MEPNLRSVLHQQRKRRTTRPGQLSGNRVLRQPRLRHGNEDSLGCRFKGKIDQKHTANLYDPLLSLKEVEALHVERVLKHCNGDRTGALRLLRIGRSTLYRHLRNRARRRRLRNLSRFASPSLIQILLARHATLPPPKMKTKSRQRVQRYSRSNSAALAVKDQGIIRHPQAD
jgi:DNA-binding protein Fis